MEIRQTIAERLKYEFDRRNLTTSNIGNQCDLSESIIESYLDGQREININEIKTICGRFNINSTRLLFSKKYLKVNLSFRNSATNVQNFASSIENVFLILKSSLPSIPIDRTERRTTRSNEKTDLITEAVSLAGAIKAEYSSPIDFLKEYSIPVLPINEPTLAFDAFLMRNENNILICINSAKPPQRILFSLAHEISHILFDSAIDVPIETFLPNFYWKKWLAQHEIAEFFAYKFAEFYLLPFDDAYRLSQTWPRLDLTLAQKLLVKHNTTKDVLANAIYDVLLVTSDYKQQSDQPLYHSQSEQFQRMDWEENNSDQIRDTVGTPGIDFLTIARNLSGLKSGNSNDTLYKFLYDSTELFGQFVSEEKSNLSDGIFEYIKGITKIEQ